MAYDDPTVPRVGKNGWRLLAPLTPGLRTPTPEVGRPGPETAKPLDVPRAELAGRARRVAGYTS